MIKRALVALVVPAALVLTACAGTSDSTGTEASPSASASATPQATTYKTVDLLRNALVSSGYPCGGWEADAESKSAGTCASIGYLEVYDSPASAADYVTTIKSETSWAYPVLYGDNWIVALTDAAAPSIERMQSKIGGQTYVNPSPTPVESFDTVEELKDAAVAAGYDCPSWEQDDAVTLATESGHCSDSDVFSMYDADAIDKGVEQERANQQQLVDNDIDTNSSVAGKNWIINPDSESSAVLLQSKLGGELITPTETSSDDAEPADYTPKKSDVELKLKTKDKQCFGSAGCNVTVEPRVTLDTGIPDTGTLTIYYTIRGAEDGALEGNIEVDLSDKTYTRDEPTVSTSGSGKKLTIKVTDVEYTDY